MNRSASPADRAAIAEAADQFEVAATAQKCWACGCLHHALETLDGAIPSAERPENLDAAVRRARERLVAIRYDCLGCEVCYPAQALNALSQAGGAVAAAAVRPRRWRPGRAGPRCPAPTRSFATAPRSPSAP
jgi:tetrahydromethanopterin S-methyltransferase subunit A